MTYTNNTYVHYGAEPFDLKNFDKISNSRRRKPIGGLWASLTFSSNNWFNWCRDEHFYIDRLKYRLEFKMKDPTKILRVSNLNDLKNLPHFFQWNTYTIDFDNLISYSDNKRIAVTEYYIEKIDFERMSETYDGFEITNFDYFLIDIIFGGYDVDTLIVLNPEAMDIIEEKKEIQ